MLRSASSFLIGGVRLLLLVAHGAHALGHLDLQHRGELLDRRRARVALGDGVQQLQRALVVLRRLARAYSSTASRTRLESVRWRASVCVTRVLLAAHARPAQRAVALQVGEQRARAAAPRSAPSSRASSAARSAAPAAAARQGAATATGRVVAGRTRTRAVRRRRLDRRGWRRRAATGAGDSTASTRRVPARPRRSDGGRRRDGGVAQPVTSATTAAMREPDRASSSAPRHPDLRRIASRPRSAAPASPTASGSHRRKCAPRSPSARSTHLDPPAVRERVFARDREPEPRALDAAVDRAACPGRTIRRCARARPASMPGPWSTTSSTAKPCSVRERHARSTPSAANT